MGTEAQLSTPHLRAMPDIHTKSIQVDLSEPTLASSQVTSDGFSYLKQNLQHVFENSDQILISNLIDNTKAVVSMARENSRSYLERTNLIENIYKEWLDLWGKYKDLPEAIDLIVFVNDLTDRLASYRYLFISLELINEGKTSNEADNRKRVTEGFASLAETIDVFCNYFSESELRDILRETKNFFKLTFRNTKEYFEEEFNFETTQFRSYCSLIIMRIEEALEPDSIVCNRSVEEKAIYRIEKRERGEPVEWIVEEGDEDIDMDTVERYLRERDLKI